MIKWLKSLFVEDSPESMEELVDLIRVAQDDQNVKKRLLDLLEQPHQQRIDEVDRWVKHCKENSAPEQFTAALGLLKDAQIAKVTLAQLLLKQD